jgi:hypothetical protein
MLELRARLIMSGEVLGGLLGPDTFRNTVTKRTMGSVDNSGHNWELLRQRAEAEGLYFEPLAMPDGRATHAMLWIAKPDLAAQTNREFHDRFLNIANPWSDQRTAKLERLFAHVLLSTATTGPLAQTIQRPTQSK